MESQSETAGGRGGLVLSQIQQRLITTALAGLSLFVICALLFGLFQILAAFVRGFSGVLMPLALAGILAMLLRPVVSFLESRLRLGRMGATVVLFALVLVLLAAGLWFVIPVLVEQSVQFIRSLPALQEGARELILGRFPQLQNFLVEAVGEEQLANLGQQAKEQLAEAARSLLSTAAATGQKFFATVFVIGAATAIIPVYLFYFLRSSPVEREKVEKELSWVRPDLRADILFLGRHFMDSIQTFFQGQILVGLIMGVLLAGGFTIAGISFGFALGIFIGLLNIVPYLGTIIGLATVLPVAWFQPEGGPVLAGTALGIFVAVQCIEGYFLTPRIMGNRTGLHPLTIIIAIFFWGTALGGILGMILAIPLTAFFVVAWRLLREKYLRYWTGG